MCKKKGCHKACITCLVAYHNHCGHACPFAAPTSQQPPTAPPNLPAARAQPPSNEEAPVPPLDNDPSLASVSHAACAGGCGYMDAPSSPCGCTEEICGRGYRFKGRVSGGERLQHYTLAKHEAWVHAPPPNRRFLIALNGLWSKRPHQTFHPMLSRRSPIRRMRSFCPLLVIGSPLRIVVTSLKVIHNVC